MLMKDMIGRRWRLCTLCSSIIKRGLISAGNSPKDALPNITFPSRVMEKIIRQRGKAAAKKQKMRTPRGGQVVISSKRPQFNHYMGQRYSDFSPQNLSSGGWKHRKSHPAWAGVEAAQFQDLGIDDDLIEQLAKFKITQPTAVQCQAIPPFLQNHNMLCAAETGSGKTLAYLLPMLQKLKALKKNPLYSQHLENHPLGLILSPSRELADQIFSVAQDLCDGIQMKPKLIVGGRGTQHVLRGDSNSEMDVLITTPGVCSKLLTTRVINASHLHSLVLDEADTLMDDSFNQLVLSIVRRLRISSEKISTDSTANSQVALGTQMALVSATMPRDLYNLMADVVPVDTMKVIKTSHLHRIMPHVSQKFLRLSSADKPKALVEHLKKSAKSGLSTMVFANKFKTAEFLSFLLTENEIENVLFHANMTEKVRYGRFSQFQSKKSKVIVCTDVASRGLDTVQAHHVINYDFPDFVSDYIHRVGRVGRVGSGQASFALSFICAKWEVDTLWQIETAARRSTEVYNVNANIKRKLVGNAEKKEMANQLDEMQ